MHCGIIWKKDTARRNSLFDYKGQEWPCALANSSLTSSYLQFAMTQQNHFPNEDPFHSSPLWAGLSNGCGFNPKNIISVIIIKTLCYIPISLQAHKQTDKHDLRKVHWSFMQIYLEEKWRHRFSSRIFWSMTSLSILFHQFLSLHLQRPACSPSPTLSFFFLAEIAAWLTFVVLIKMFHQIHTVAVRMNCYTA